MALASDDAPDWGAAEDSLHDAQHRSDSSHEHSEPPGNLHVKRVEMLDIHEEAESDENEHEADALMGDYERQLYKVRDSFEPPSPRTQTDLSDAVPRLAFMDQPSDELYRPILDSPDLAYKLYPINLRPLPGADDEPTGLIQDTRFRPADTYPNDHPTWVPDHPDCHPTSLVDYDLLAQWLA